MRRSNQIRAPIHHPDIIHQVDPSRRQMAVSVAGLAVVEVNLAHVALVQIYIHIRVGELASVDPRADASRRSRVPNHWAHRGT